MIKRKSPKIAYPQPAELETQLFSVEKMLVLTNIKTKEISFHHTKTDVLIFLNSNKHVTEYCVTTQNVPVDFIIY